MRPRRGSAVALVVLKSASGTILGRGFESHPRAEGHDNRLVRRNLEPQSQRRESRRCGPRPRPAQPFTVARTISRHEPALSPGCRGTAASFLSGYRNHLGLIEHTYGHSVAQNLAGLSPDGKAVGEPQGGANRNAVGYMLALSAIRRAVAWPSVAV